MARKKSPSSKKDSSPAPMSDKELMAYLDKVEEDLARAPSTDQMVEAALATGAGLHIETPTTVVDVAPAVPPPPKTCPYCRHFPCICAAAEDAAVGEAFITLAYVLLFLLLLFLLGTTIAYWILTANSWAHVGIFKFDGTSAKVITSPGATVAEPKFVDGTTKNVYSGFGLQYDQNGSDQYFAMLQGYTETPKVMPVVQSGAWNVSDTKSAASWDVQDVSAKKQVSLTSFGGFAVEGPSALSPLQNASSVYSRYFAFLREEVPHLYRIVFDSQDLSKVSKVEDYARENSVEAARSYANGLIKNMFWQTFLIGAARVLYLVVVHERNVAFYAPATFDTPTWLFTEALPFPTFAGTLESTIRDVAVSPETATNRLSVLFNHVDVRGTAGNLLGDATHQDGFSTVRVYVSADSLVFTQDYVVGGTDVTGNVINVLCSSILFMRTTETTSYDYFFLAPAITNQTPYFLGYHKKYESVKSIYIPQLVEALNTYPKFPSGIAKIKFTHDRKYLVVETRECYDIFGYPNQQSVLYAFNTKHLVNYHSGVTSNFVGYQRLACYWRTLWRSLRQLTEDSSEMRWFVTNDAKNYYVSAFHVDGSVVTFHMPIPV